MPATIFPFELAFPNIESLNGRINRRSSLMYCLMLGFLSLALVALPLVKIDIGVQARGVIRDVQNNTPITSIVQGQVLSHGLIEDRRVEKGEKLLLLNAEVLEAEQEKIATQLKEAEYAEQDLTELLDKEASTPLLCTNLYLQEFSKYTREYSNLEIKKQYYIETLERVRKLYKEQVVAKIEFEKAQLDADLANNELRILEEQQRKTWEIEAQNTHQRILDLKAQFNLLQRQRRDYAIYAPCGGMLVQTTGLQAGSYIMPGQQLAFISTQDSLLAEVYIPTNQIGYIQKGMKVRLLIDAYNFHEWGAIEGIVQSVPIEVKVINDVAVFVTPVRLSQKELSLKNGYLGQLKKGMSLSARFFLQRRSLLALLYDKAEDWLDPRKTSTQ